MLNPSKNISGIPNMPAKEMCQENNKLINVVGISKGAKFQGSEQNQKRTDFARVDSELYDLINTGLISSHVIKGREKEMIDALAAIFKSAAKNLPSVKPEVMAKALINMFLYHDVSDWANYLKQESLFGLSDLSPRSQTSAKKILQQCLPRTLNVVKGYIQHVDAVAHAQKNAALRLRENDAQRLESVIKRVESETKTIHNSKADALIDVIKDICDTSTIFMRSDKSLDQYRSAASALQSLQEIPDIKLSSSLILELKKTQIDLETFKKDNSKSFEKDLEFIVDKARVAGLRLYKGVIQLIGYSERSPLSSSFLTTEVKELQQQHVKNESYEHINVSGTTNCHFILHAIEAITNVTRVLPAALSATTRATSNEELHSDHVSNAPTQSESIQFANMYFRDGEIHQEEMVLLNAQGDVETTDTAGGFLPVSSAASLEKSHLLKTKKRLESDQLTMPNPPETEHAVKVHDNATDMTDMRLDTLSYGKSSAIMTGHASNSKNDIQSEHSFDLGNVQNLHIENNYFGKPPAENQFREHVFIADGRPDDPMEVIVSWTRPGSRKGHSINLSNAMVAEPESMSHSRKIKILLEQNESVQLFVRDTKTGKHRTEWVHSNFPWVSLQENERLWKYQSEDGSIVNNCDESASPATFAQFNPDCSLVPYTSAQKTISSPELEDFRAKATTLEISLAPLLRNERFDDTAFMPQEAVDAMNQHFKSYTPANHPKPIDVKTDYAKVYVDEFDKIERTVNIHGETFTFYTTGSEKKPIIQGKPVTLGQILLNNIGDLKSKETSDGNFAQYYDSSLYSKVDGREIILDTHNIALSSLENAKRELYQDGYLLEVIKNSVNSRVSASGYYEKLSEYYSTAMYRDALSAYCQNNISLKTLGSIKHFINRAESILSIDGITYETCNVKIGNTALPDALIFMPRSKSGSHIVYIPGNPEGFMKELGNIDLVKTQFLSMLLSDEKIKILESAASPLQVSRVSEEKQHILKNLNKINHYKRDSLLSISRIDIQNSNFWESIIKKRHAIRWQIRDFYFNEETHQVKSLHASAADIFNTILDLALGFIPVVGQMYMLGKLTNELADIHHKFRNGVISRQAQLEMSSRLIALALLELAGDLLIDIPTSAISGMVKKALIHNVDFNFDLPSARFSPSAPLAGYIPDPSELSVNITPDLPSSKGIYTIGSEQFVKMRGEEGPVFVKIHAPGGNQAPSAVVDSLPGTTFPLLKHGNIYTFDTAEIYKSVSDADLLCAHFPYSYGPFTTQGSFIADELYKSFGLTRHKLISYDQSGIRPAGLRNAIEAIEASRSSHAITSSLNSGKPLSAFETRLAHQVLVEETGLNIGIYSATIKNTQYNPGKKISTDNPPDISRKPEIKILATQQGLFIPELSPLMQPTHFTQAVQSHTQTPFTTITQVNNLMLRRLSSKNNNDRVAILIPEATIQSEYLRSLNVFTEKLSQFDLNDVKNTLCAFAQQTPGHNVRLFSDPDTPDSRILFETAGQYVDYRDLDIGITLDGNGRLSRAWFKNGQIWQQLQPTDDNIVIAALIKAKTQKPGIIKFTEIRDMARRLKHHYAEFHYNPEHDLYQYSVYDEKTLLALTDKLRPGLMSVGPDTFVALPVSADGVSVFRVNPHPAKSQYGLQAHEIVYKNDLYQDVPTGEYLELSEDSSARLVNAGHSPLFPVTGSSAQIPRQIIDDTAYYALATDKNIIVEGSRIRQADKVWIVTKDKRLIDENLATPDDVYACVNPVAASTHSRVKRTINQQKIQGTVCTFGTPLKILDDAKKIFSSPMIKGVEPFEQFQQVSASGSAKNVGGEGSSIVFIANQPYFVGRKKDAVELFSSKPHSVSEITQHMRSSSLGYHSAQSSTGMSSSATSPVVPESPEVFDSNFGSNNVFFPDKTSRIKSTAGMRGSVASTSSSTSSGRLKSLGNDKAYLNAIPAANIAYVQNNEIVVSILRFTDDHRGFLGETDEMYRIDHVIGIPDMRTIDGTFNTHTCSGVAAQADNGKTYLLWGTNEQYYYSILDENASGIYPSRMTFRKLNVEMQKSGEIVTITVPDSDITNVDDRLYAEQALKSVYDMLEMRREAAVRMEMPQSYVEPFLNEIQTDVAQNDVVMLDKFTQPEYKLTKRQVYWLSLNNRNAMYGQMSTDARYAETINMEAEHIEQFRDAFNALWVEEITHREMWQSYTDKAPPARAKDVPLATRAEQTFHHLSSTSDAADIKQIMDNLSFLGPYGQVVNTLFYLNKVKITDRSTGITQEKTLVMFGVSGKFSPESNDAAPVYPGIIKNKALLETKDYLFVNVDRYILDNNLCRQSTISPPVSSTKFGVTLETAMKEGRFYDTEAKANDIIHHLSNDNPENIRKVTFSNNGFYISKIMPCQSCRLIVHKWKENNLFTKGYHNTGTDTPLNTR